MTQKPSQPSRRRFLGTMGAAAAAVPLVAGTTQTSLSLKKVPGRKPRNVIYILSDDHR